MTALSVVSGPESLYLDTSHWIAGSGARHDEVIFEAIVKDTNRLVPVCFGDVMLQKRSDLDIRYYEIAAL